MEWTSLSASNIALMPTSAHSKPVAISQGRITYLAYTYCHPLRSELFLALVRRLRFDGGSGPQYDWARVYSKRDTLDFIVIDYA
jgi:hypothetical protein